MVSLLSFSLTSSSSSCLPHLLLLLPLLPPPRSSSSSSSSRCLLHQVVGNFTAEETAKFVSEAIASMSPKPLSPANVPKLRISKLAEGVTVLHEQLGPDPVRVVSRLFQAMWSCSAGNGCAWQCNRDAVW
eukprot:3781188-Rhodomonas_salina.1